MKIKVYKNKLPIAPEMFMRQAGYVYNAGQGDKQDSFERVLSRTGYPKFHIYINYEADAVELNLHLDQKKPSYKGVKAHSGEHEGEVVEEEVKRLKSLIVQIVKTEK